MRRSTSYVREGHRPPHWGRSSDRKWPGCNNLRRCSHVTDEDCHLLQSEGRWSVSIACWLMLSIWLVLKNILEFGNRLRCSDRSVILAVGTTKLKGRGPDKVRQVSCSLLPVWWNGRIWGSRQQTAWRVALRLLNKWTSINERCYCNITCIEMYPTPVRAKTTSTPEIFI